MGNISLCVWLAFHPVHVTLTSVEQIRGTDSLFVLVKMDYALFLRDYRTIDDDRNVERYIDKPFPAIFAYRYLESKIAIYIDNKLLYGKLLNLEVLGEEINLRILYNPGRKPGKLKIRNTFLIGLYGDAENYTIISVGNLEQGIKMTSEYQEETLKLN